uniref:Uncharacterized protein n=2 Tax=Picea TaxID=3328 RepID=A0A101M581_PICGL|nr:hypothetical protein ABT39_MTgene1158 [Picea glauca]QHR91716.1 hypothetical protein Q903MT_gene5752 [Picea sitchensis]
MDIRSDLACKRSTLQHLNRSIPAFNKHSKCPVHSKRKCPVLFVNIPIVNSIGMDSLLCFSSWPLSFDT